MKPCQYEILRAVEDTHWWHAVLHRLVMGALRPLPDGARVLDAGCGTGGLLARLGRLEAHGCDLSAAAVEHCRRRGLRHVQVGDVSSLPYESGGFDTVLSLDVLYHASVNPARALDEMRRVLRPRGMLVVNVPALDCLRGAHDEAVCGARRYSRRSLTSLLENHGFTPERVQYWNAWLTAPLWLRRRFSRNPEGDLALPPRWMNTLLALGSHVDAHLCRVLRVPFGSSLFAVARSHPPP
ncbi:MAG: methyltransferase domain-containing protein [Verrucomicrobiaceae bacterium]|nr:methyltransferase domain-containing protein [Verrucomicrobiaceae bacterium]